uniref:Uncharacterized protein n=1 Tax=Melon chlorotic spot virus TaxID=2479459 RepID=A0A481T0N9_9VIRU|nr:hypothetical protein [Melon chlorotic spot virus]
MASRLDNFDLVVSALISPEFFSIIKYDNNLKPYQLDTLFSKQRCSLIALYTLYYLDVFSPGLALELLKYINDLELMIIRTTNNN